MPLDRALAQLEDFVFPARCPSCGEAVASPELDAEVALCAVCWSQLDIPGSPACTACQHPFGADHFEDTALCARCMIKSPQHDGIHAATIYGPISRGLILALKHGGRIALAGPMGRMLARRILDLGPDVLVVPVPLHRWRLWHRGYNQAALLASSLACARGWRTEAGILVRRKSTPALGGLNPAERREVLKAAIAVRPRHAAELKGCTVLLVDDVLTSGATTDQCVSALKRAGAHRVVIACYARVLSADAVPQAKTPGTVESQASA